MVGGRAPRGDRQQPPGHPRLREALDRRGRRLLEGARHPRDRSDGGPRDLPDLQPARRELAAPRRRHVRPGRGGAAPDGRRRRRAAGGAGVRAAGPVVRRRGVPRGTRPGLRRTQPAVGLHRADPAPAPAGQEARGLMTTDDLAGTLLARLDERLAEGDAELAAQYPGERPGRQPVHTVYVPADRYDAALVPAYGEAALRLIDEHADRFGALVGDAGLVERVRAKLGSEPV